VILLGIFPCEVLNYTLGKELGDKDLQPADDLALLASNTLVSAWHISG
jgi:hypothetical protein